MTRILLDILKFAVSVTSLTVITLLIGVALS